MTSPTQPKSPSEIPKETIKQAIAEGKALLKEGKTKVEAATAIYAKLKSADRETVVAAFMEGASLTPAGALTYWYNCRRKAGKASRTS